MKHQQTLVTSQVRNTHVGEPCESGYSTTTSSEEGTLQRGFTQAYYTEKPKSTNMVSKGIAMEEARTKKVTSRHHKRRIKQNNLPRPPSPQSQQSPYSSTSSLTQQYSYQDNESLHLDDLRRRKPQRQHPVMMSLNDVTDQHHSIIPNIGHQNLADRSSLDEMTSSFEELDCSEEHYDVSENVNGDIIKSAAIQQFHQSMNKIKSYQTDKTPKKGGNQMDYYRVGDFAPNPYYDPLDISDNMWGPSKKRVTISISPSSSSGTGSPHKPSPIRSILKIPKQSPQYSTSSTPVRKNSLNDTQQYSKSEENLASIKRITPPSLSSPLSPRDRKSAFVVVKPRITNRPTLPDGPMVAIHPPVHQMLMQNGFEPHLDHNEGYQGVDNQTLQMLVTPRNSVRPAPHNPSIQHQFIYGQLPRTQAVRPTDLNIENINSGHTAPNNSGSGKNIIYIPAQIDENGIARPLPQNVTQLPEPHGTYDNCTYHNNGHRHDNVHHYDSVNNHDISSHNANISRSNSNHDNSSIETDSPLPPAETLSNEAVRLRHFLDKANADDLKLRLEKLLESKDPSSILALTKLFPGTEFTADAAHCVRCHKDFNPRDPGRCMLPHPERMVAKISQDEMGADFVCGCCNAGFRLIKMDFYEESTNALLTGHCYSGTHTTEPDSVDYRIDGGSAKSCEEYGCVEFYV